MGGGFRSVGCTECFVFFDVYIMRIYYWFKKCNIFIYKLDCRIYFCKEIVRVCVKVRRLFVIGNRIGYGYD